MCIATNNHCYALPPYGNGDILQTAMLAMSVVILGGGNDDLENVLPMITDNPAKSNRLRIYGMCLCFANHNVVILEWFCSYLGYYLS